MGPQFRFRKLEGLKFPSNLTFDKINFTIYIRLIRRISYSSIFDFPAFFLYFGSVKNIPISILLSSIFLIFGLQQKLSILSTLPMLPWGNRCHILCDILFPNGREINEIDNLHSIEHRTRRCIWRKINQGKISWYYSQNARNLLCEKRKIRGSLKYASVVIIRNGIMRWNWIKIKVILIN